MRRFLFHPSADALARFAHGDDAPAGRESVMAHLAHCVECRASIMFQRDVRAAARRLDAPLAPQRVIARVLAERAAGERAILPAVAPVRVAPRRYLRRAGLIVVAAAIGALMIRQATRPGLRAVVEDAAVDSVSSLHELFVSAGFLPDVASAQELPSQPVVPAISGIDGTRLRPTRINVESRWVDSAGRITVDGNGVVELTADSYLGAPVWRLTHESKLHAGDGGQLRSEAETLWVRRDDLRPLARSVRVAPYGRYSQIIVRQRFHADSISGDMYTDGGVHRTFARRLPANYAPFTTDALAPLFLGAVQLTPTWSGSIALIGWGVVTNDVVYPASLRVVGEERGRVPPMSGSCDCWRMRISTAAGDRSLWVRKSDGRGMLLRVDSRRTAKGIREVVITDR